MFKVKECSFLTNVAHLISIFFWTFHCLSEIIQICHMIFEIQSHFCINFAPFCNKLVSVYLFLEFEPQLGKSEKFYNQGMKENKAFRISFITKAELKSRQALHRIFWKTQYIVYRGASILYFKTSFSDVPPFSKMSQPPCQNQQMVLKSVSYHPCP